MGNEIQDKDQQMAALEENLTDLMIKEENLERDIQELTNKDIQSQARISELDAELSSLIQGFSDL